MHRVVGWWAAGLGLALSGCVGKAGVPVAPSESVTAQCGLRDNGAHAFRILHLNDVYRIEGLADGRGGLARVRQLRKELEADCAEAVLLTHAGDALFPSLLSREFDGAQMIDVLNLLDGDVSAHDPLMFATLGNHEFDKSRLEHAAMLQQRLRESQFTWFDTNITWHQGTDGPLVSSDSMQHHAIVNVGGVAVGLFGVTIDNKVPAYVDHIDTDVVEIARVQTQALRAQGAQVVIALTHLDVTQDQAILGLGEAGPDLVLGGHDHVLQTETVGGRPVLKGDADAARVRTVEVQVDPEEAVSWTSDKAGVALRPDTVAPDPEVLARVQGHLDAFALAFCGDQPACLTAPLTTTTVELVAEETRIRRYETNLGDWVADQMLATFPDADIAVVNSGALRLNQDVGAGTAITRQIVEEIFAYPAPMHQIEVPGRVVSAMVARGVQDWTGQGHWLQVAGLAFRHDPEAESAGDLHVVTAEGLVPLDEDATYRVVTVDYLLDPSIGDQDGFTMLSRSQIQPTATDGTDLKVVVLQALEQAGKDGIAPVRRGRICNTGEPSAPCLLDE